jgi:hypothetical protein
MLLGKTRILPLSGVPEKCFTRVGSGTIHKTLDSAVKPYQDKHSSLLSLFVSYEENEALWIWPLDMDTHHFILFIKYKLAQ